MRTAAEIALERATSGEFETTYREQRKAAELAAIESELNAAVRAGILDWLESEAMREKPDVAQLAGKPIFRRS